MADRTALGALNEADMFAQGVYKLADATVAAVRALLVEPDSSTMRMSVLQLVERLGDEAFRAMNEINCMAGTFGVNFKDDEGSAKHRAICNAVRTEGVHHG